MRWQSYLSRYWQKAEPLLPGSFVSVAIVSLLKLGVWQSLDCLAYQGLFRLRGPLTWDSRVVVVAIDEPSLKTLGRFPWPRRRYAELLNRLTQADASTVVLDLLLTETSPDDRELVAAMSRQGRVVLAQAWDATGSPLLPNPTLSETAANQGHIYQQQDADGLTRTIEPNLQGIPALGVAAAQVYSLVREAIPIPESHQRLWINWLGPVAQAPTYSYVDVLQGKVPLEQFRNKIVLIGVTAGGFDPLRTPFDQTPPTTNIYLHATVVNNLLQQNFLKVVPQHWLILGLLLAGPCLSAVVPRHNFWRLMLGLGGLCGTWAGLSVLLFYSGYWIPIAPPIALLICTTIAVAFSERWKENVLLQQEIDRLWQTYRKDIVIQSHPLSSESANLSLQEPTQLSPTIALPHVAKLATLAEQFGRSQSAQAAIARSASVGLIAADLGGQIWFCNPIATLHLQVRVGDRLQTRLIPDWLTAAQWQQYLDKLQYCPPQNLEVLIAPWEVQHHDRWFELKLEPLQGYESNNIHQLDGLLLILKDITSSKQVEQNLQRQMQELQQLSQLKDDFLSTVSHELRTPMANMKMAIRMLQIAKAEAQRDRYLQILADECSREIGLINDLLDLQRLEAGAKVFTPEAIQLQDWLPQLLQPFYERVQARQQTLQFQLKPDVPPFFSDQASLERILAELINNACKYTPPEGNIQLTVEMATDRVQFQISNSGSEIPETEIDKIFDKFYRVPSGDRWKQGGTGLGLALVKKLVDHLGGTIQVASNSEGTTFTLQLTLLKD